MDTRHALTFNFGNTMEEKLNALIVDDEERARDLMVGLLEDTRQFFHIRSAHSAEAALTILENFDPNLIFLDIQMPGKDGLSFLRDLTVKRISAEIIFVTAFEHFALEALRMHAFGYLLKPVSREELNECIEHYKSRRMMPGYLDRLTRLLHTLQEYSKLRFNSRTGFIFVDPANIIFCQADGNYTLIQEDEKKHLCSVQLGVIALQLKVPGFIRLGRSLIINFKYLVRVERKQLQLTLEKDGQTFTLDVTRGQLRELEKMQLP